MEDMMDRIERHIESAMAEAERCRRDLDTAHAAGKEIIQVVCDPHTKRGDIIEITPVEDVEKEEGEVKTIRVVACHQMMGFDPETMETHEICYAFGIVLEAGDITTEEEFAALYAGEDAPEAVEASESDEEPAEAADPNVCECGANREMCERNQGVFGGHLNE